MVTVSKLLVPVDLDRDSSRVVDWGRMLADKCGASLHLLHVIGYPLANPEHEEAERGEACRRLELLMDRKDREARRATVACEVGAAGPAIIRYAIDNAIDLIVMGTHTHGPTFQMVSGSIAESVVRGAPCAVLAVKDGA
jgi:nucleotide-binding universal stress UspA family protein